MYREGKVPLYFVKNSCSGNLTVLPDDQQSYNSCPGIIIVVEHPDSGVEEMNDFLINVQRIANK